MELLVGPDNGARTVGAPIPRWYVETGVRAQNLDAHTKGSRAKLVLSKQHVPDGLANPLWMCVFMGIMRSRFQREELKALSERRFNVTSTKS